MNGSGGGSLKKKLVVVFSVAMVASVAIVGDRVGVATGNNVAAVAAMQECLTAVSGEAWQSGAFYSQSGTFTAEFDATPSASPINSVVALSQGEQNAYTGFAALARFNPSGDIDARNGGSFAAESTIAYSAGVKYHFRLVANVAAHTYSIYVTPEEESELTVGTDFAFRSEQSGVTSLDRWGVYANRSHEGSTTVCNFAISGGPTPCDIPGNSALWRDFVDATAAGLEPMLPDFSYAGYNYSETPIPDVTGPIFNVADHGATSDDDTYDDEGIQAAINAAEAAGGGVVLFAAGKYLVNPTEDSSHFITVNGSNIVLRGAGSGDGGTEVLMVAKKQGGSMFRVFPTSFSQGTVANIIEDATRESFWVTVDSTSRLRVGQRVIIRYQNTEYNDFYYWPLTLDPDWVRVVNNGVGIHEMHQIAEISDNRVRFKEPLHFTLLMGSTPHRLEAVRPLEEVGIEDIRFTGSWDTYPETFVHHRDWIHDSGWSLLSINRVANGWVRRCEFRHFNGGLGTDSLAAFTVEEVKFTGKKGHSSIGTRRSYGFLVKDSEDTASTHHGPGTGYNCVGTVYLRYRMMVNQSVDNHGGVPHATLLDRVTGGVLSGNGGPLDNYPHHGKYMTMWNFFHRATSSRNYDFWNNVSRNSNTFTLPIFAGFTSNNSVVFQDEATEVMYNESFGTAVTPDSLFEAQLALRLCRQQR